MNRNEFFQNSNKRVQRTTLAKILSSSRKVPISEIFTPKIKIRKSKCIQH